MTAVDSPLVQSDQVTNQDAEPDGTNSLQILEAEFSRNYRHEKEEIFEVFDETLFNDLSQLSVACARSQRPLAEALAYWNIAIMQENCGYNSEAFAQFSKFIVPCKRAGYTPGVLTGLSSAAVSLFLQQNYQ